MSMRSRLSEGEPEMPWYFYRLKFVSGLFFADDFPRFVQGVSGHWFQSPLTRPESASPAEQHPLGSCKSDS
jgi:hypothetical protein